MNAMNQPYITNTDLMHLNNANAKGKIYHIFEKVPFYFNFFIINTSETKLMQKFTKEQLENILGKPVKTENTITIVYTHNVAASHRIPFNAWTLAHRIAHIVQANGKSDNLIQVIHGGLANIEASLSGQEDNRKYGFLDNHSNIIAQAQSLFTMRSAREKIMVTSLDIEAELIAQYFITGDLKFNDALTFYQNLISDEKNKSYHIIPPSDNMLEHTQKLIDQYKIDCKNAINQTLKHMIGGIYSF